MGARYPTGIKCSECRYIITMASCCTDAIKQAIAAAEARGIERAAKWLEGRGAYIDARRAQELRRALLPSQEAATGWQGPASRVFREFVSSEFGDETLREMDKAKAEAAPPAVQSKCDTTAGPCACGAWHSKGGDSTK
jgi:hypothetical protein